MNGYDPLEYASWQLVADDLRAENLPSIATDALVRGRDSPLLRELAGETPNDVQNNRDRFIRVLEELGVDLLDVDSALWRLVIAKASAIVAGSLDPYEGARWIGYANVEDDTDLNRFYWLADEVDENPGNLAAIEQRIVNSAAELLRLSLPRRRVTLRATAVGSPVTRHNATVNKTVDVALEDLRLSPELHAEVSHWNGDFIRTVTQEPSGGFSSRSEAKSFVDRGADLASRLEAELGSNHVVEYQREPQLPSGARLVRRNRAKLRAWVRKLLGSR